MRSFIPTNSISNNLSRRVTGPILYSILLDSPPSCRLQQHRPSFSIIIIIMTEFQQFFQSVFFGLLFSFLLAKLFSILFAFRNQNLHITRSDNLDIEPNQAHQKDPADVSNEDDERRLKKSDVEKIGGGGDVSDGGDDVSIDERRLKKSEVKKIGGGDDVSGGGGDEGDSDWEGVESTELDEAFSAATAFVAATAADRDSVKVSTDVQLQLYGLYKIATEGPCTSPSPSMLKMTARAKWQAWQKLGAMPPEEAMEKYLDIVTDLYPTWCTGSETKWNGEENKGSSDSKGPMGPVFSTFSFEEESGTQLQMDAIHSFAREGDEENLLKCIESGFSVNVKDSEGRTPLHWAVDRGHQSVVELLISKNSDLNIKDDEGQTPLHYAAVCERAAIAELLVKQKADLHIRDNDGNSPSDLCEQSWPWMQNRQ
ncbi:hypothetical protein LIER_24783 [Lithospermum erythrorhizon]|uniref:ACB domain-containing protein n=1 Tax=Lithospermum erythrorhizon TaxID=34254 RepID=A0AAV3R6F1_LITER